MKTSFSIQNENFILDSMRIFMKVFHLLLFHGSFIFPQCILIFGLILLLDRRYLAFSRKRNSKICFQIATVFLQERDLIFCCYDCKRQTYTKWKKERKGKENNGFLCYAEPVAGEGPDWSHFHHRPIAIVAGVVGDGRLRYVELSSEVPRSQRKRRKGFCVLCSQRRRRQKKTEAQE